MPRVRRRQLPTPKPAPEPFTPLSKVQIRAEHNDINGHDTIDTSTPYIPVNLYAEHPNGEQDHEEGIIICPHDKILQAQAEIQDAVGEDIDCQYTAIDNAIGLLYPYRPRSGQRLALHCLIYQRKDLILIAKTSFGKSMILQALSVLVARSITLIILPLRQIGEEQTAYINHIGGQSCFLNADTISANTLDEIKEGRFSHILISPELAISNQFRSIAISPEFQSRLALVVVDEVHLVSHWGRDFRPAYARLNIIRSMLGISTPWFACSATLDQHTLDSVIKNIGFEYNIRILRTSIDRPELTIRVGIIPKKSQIPQIRALRYIFSQEVSPGDRANGQRPRAYQMPGDIPKTIVFFNTTREARHAREFMRSWLQDSEAHSYERSTAEQTVQVFHRRLAEHDKDSIIAEFQKPAQNSSIRVICATEALGIGVNLPDVRRVIQWSIQKETDPAVFWQRGGRASRDKKQGEMIIFLDPDKIDPARSSHGKLTKFWYTLARRDPVTCYRQHFLDFFNEPDSCCELSPACDCDHHAAESCCSVCDKGLPALDMTDEDFYLYQTKGRGSNQRTKKVLQQIEKWAAERADEYYQGQLLIPHPDQVLSKTKREQIANNAGMISCKADLEKWVGQRWVFYAQHGEELAHIVWNAWLASSGSSQLSSQTPLSSQSQALSQCDSTDLFQTPLTPESMSQPASLQTKDSQSLSTPNHSSPTPNIRNLGSRKRMALGNISSNIGIKKTKPTVSRAGSKDQGEGISNRLN